jgi:hypothetical protein
MNWTIYLLGIVLPYTLGVKSWYLILSWVPTVWMLAAVWAYVGKYLLPPQLDRCVLKPPSILGLGPG